MCFLQTEIFQGIDEQRFKTTKPSSFYKRAESSKAQNIFYSTNSCLSPHKNHVLNLNNVKTNMATIVNTKTTFPQDYNSQRYFELKELFLYENSNLK